MWSLHTRSWQGAMCSSTCHCGGQRLAASAIVSWLTDVTAMLTLRDIVHALDPGGPPLWRRSDSDVLAVVQRWLDLGRLKRCSLAADHTTHDKAANIARSPEALVLHQLHDRTDNLRWQGQAWRFIHAGQWQALAEQSQFQIVQVDDARKVLGCMAADPSSTPVPAALLQQALTLLHDTHRHLHGDGLLLLLRTRQGAAVRSPSQAVYTPAQLAAELAQAKATAAARAAGASAGAAQSTHWIEVELMHQDRSPALGHACEIRPPDGRTFRATTDAQGLVRWDGHAAGLCKVHFPGLDGGTWKPSHPVRSPVAATTHVVQPGECLSGIALALGFHDWRALYHHASNAELRRERPDPDVLYPGDTVRVPEIDEQPERCDTDRRHTFVLREPRRNLRVHMLDEHKAPLPDQPCVADAGGLMLYGCTDAKGWLTLELPADAQAVEIWTGGLRRRLELGALNPMRNTPDDGLSGVQGRLLALGFDPGPIDGVMGPRTGAALVAFQRHRRLPRSGRADTATLDRLSQECRP